jgi:hypothetical protein
MGTDPIDAFEAKFEGLAIHKWPMRAKMNVLWGVIAVLIIYELASRSTGVGEL